MVIAMTRARFASHQEGVSEHRPSELLMFLSALSALVVFNFLELGVDNIALIRLFRLGFSTLGSGGRTFSLLRRIHLLRNASRRFGQLGRGSLHRGGIITLNRTLYLGDSGFDGSTLVIGSVFARLF